MFFPSTCDNVVENFILNNIIYLIFIFCLAPDEANFEDLVKASDHTINLFC